MHNAQASTANSRTGTQKRPASAQEMPGHDTDADGLLEVK